MNQQHQLGLLTPGLMPPDNDVLASQLRASRPGMAHFGSTGPAERTCRECRHWGRSARFKRQEGELCPRRCQKFSSLMDGAVGAGVPHAQPSCRHFSGREHAPNIVPAPRKKSSEVS